MTVSLPTYPVVVIAQAVLFGPTAVAMGVSGRVVALIRRPVRMSQIRSDVPTVPARAGRPWMSPTDGFCSSKVAQTWAAGFLRTRSQTWKSRQLTLNRATGRRFSV
jgi:hypothetical protein